MIRTLKAHRMSLDHGFTMVELAVVVVLMGVMAATVLPKFVDLSALAYRAVAADAHGSIKSALAMTHAKWLTSGRPGYLSFDTAGGMTKLYVNSAGYPVSTNGMTSISGQNGNCVAVLNALLNGQYAVDKTAIDVGGDARKYRWCVKAGFHGWQANTGAEVCNFTLIKPKSGSYRNACYPSSTDQVVTYYPGTGIVTGAGF